MKFILEQDFSDGIDTLCKKCGERRNKCICNNATKKILPRDSHKIKSKLKKVQNKLVSSFYPFYIENEKEILSILKKKLACGGNIESIDDYVIINLQGDVTDKAKIELQKLGFKIN